MKEHNKTNSILASLLSKHGQIVTVHTARPVKVKKGNPEVIKDSTYQVRIGAEYDNLKNVKEKRESGELPAENQGLIGREWVHYPTILKSTKTGELYVRCSVVRNNFVPKTKFLIGNEEVEKDVVKSMAYASEFGSSERDNDCFDIKLANILELKG